MSPPVTELPPDHHYSPPPATEGFEQYYDTYSTLPAPTVPVSDYYTSENLYLWQDVDGVYHWADASAARFNSSLGYPSPSYYAPALAPEVRFSTPGFGPSLTPHLEQPNYCGYRRSDLEEPLQPATIQDDSYIFHLAQQFRNGTGRPQAQDHRSSIARASDNFLAQGSPIFSDGHSSLRRRSTLDYQSSISLQSNHQRDARPPSRKRPREAIDDQSYHVKEEDDSTHPTSLPTTNSCRLPKSHMMVSPQALSSSRRVPISLNADSHVCEHESRLRPDDRCMISVPKHISNKRVRSSADLVRQESAIPSMPATWSIPDDQVIKGTKKPGEQKKQALACLFCRERKIACGRPPAHNPDQTCNQCARRRMKCEYPTESRRGQHKRRRKPVEGESTGESAVRTNSMSIVAPTTTTSSSTTLTTSTSST